MEYTIAETYKLPSRGKIYSKNVKDSVKLRSMTVDEEMQRLSHSDTPYKTMCDIIDACMVESPGISSYDMHLGDYQYLLHRLRVVTYGSNYSSVSVCPICGTSNKSKIDLDDLKIFSLDKDSDLKEFQDLLEVDLPKSNHHIKLKFLTARDKDEILAEEREYIANNPDNNVNIQYLYNLRHLIDTVDGKSVNKVSLDIFLRKLALSDSNLILQRAYKLDTKVGIDTSIKNKCNNPKCGAKYNTSFRITNEFFGPTTY